MFLYNTSFALPRLKFGSSLNTSLKGTTKYENCPQSYSTILNKLESNHSVALADHWPIATWHLEKNTLLEIGVKNPIHDSEKTAKRWL